VLSLQGRQAACPVARTGKATEVEMAARAVMVAMVATAGGATPAVAETAEVAVTSAPAMAVLGVAEPTAPVAAEGVALALALAGRERMGQTAAFRDLAAPTAQVTGPVAQVAAVAVPAPTEPAPTEPARVALAAVLVGTARVGCLAVLDRAREVQGQGQVVRVEPGLVEQGLVEPALLEPALVEPALVEPAGRAEQVVPGEQVGRTGRAPVVMAPGLLLVVLVGLVPEGLVARAELGVRAALAGPVQLVGPAVSAQGMPMARDLARRVALRCATGK